MAQGLIEDYLEKQKPPPPKKFRLPWIIHPNWVLLIKTVLLTLALFSFFRILFFFKYSEFFSGISFTAGLGSFIHGLRFDISTVFLIYTVPFIILFFPGQWVLSNRFRLISRIALLTLTGLLIAVLYTDLQYYGYVNRHLCNELFQILNDLGSMIKIAFTTYIWGIIWFTVFMVLFWFFLKYFFKSVPEDTLKIMDRKSLFHFMITRPAVNILILLLIAAAAIRGGLQTKPLRVSHAFTSDRIILGHFSLNGLFTSLKALYKPGISLDLAVKEDIAVSTVQGLLEDRHTRFLTDRYPLMREHDENTPEAPLPNVVFFIMESWTGRFIGALGAEEKVTPHFDSLAEEGRLFTRFFAVGQRSKDAIVSLLYSFPSFTSLTVAGKVYEQNIMIGIGNILKAQGYSSIFLCGAKRGSMGFDFLSAKAGFDTYIAAEDFKLPDSSFDGTWGVYDEHMFNRAHEEFSRMKQPFIGAVFTLHPHEPYKLPSDEFNVSQGKEESSYLNALHYSDWTLGRFFEKARESEYFKNTLFVIVADHAEGKYVKSVYDSFRIPCLFYFPGKVLPAQDSKVGSQLDILPTVIDILGIRTVHSSFGASLLGTAERTALISYGNVIGWFRDDYALVHGIDTILGFYNFRTDPLFDTNLLDTEDRIPEVYENELFSFVGLAAKLLRENRIATLGRESH